LDNSIKQAASAGKGARRGKKDGGIPGERNRKRKARKLTMKRLRGKRTAAKGRGKIDEK